MVRKVRLLSIFAVAKFLLLNQTNLPDKLRDCSWSVEIIQ